MPKIIPVTLLVLFTYSGLSQVYTNKPGKKQQVNTDTLGPYDDVLPILGRKAHERGFDLPYSAGISLNYLFQESSIIINNLQVGFNKGDMYNLDNIIRFNDATAATNAFNFRPDIWVFPFLNVYGIFSGSKSSTAVDFSVNVPNGTGYTEVLTAKTKAEFQATTVGFGLTPTFGVAGAFVAIDMNFSWSDIPELSKPAYVFVLGPRVGKNFRFKKERALAVWVGGFRVDINSRTDGSIPLSSLFDSGELAGKIEAGYIRLDEAQTNLDNWWSRLSASEKKQNATKYAVAQAAITKAGDVLNEVESSNGRIGNSTIEYSLDKRQEKLWNFVLGTQYQLNKSFMFRVEAGFLGTRNQVIAGVQYRFGL
ncbi:MAG: hypothetical protein CL840_13985 [Crocinitomicaceae bacterium]|nr:hypothetical protein [Crocinitomicaceae bacterium]|tara:strand:- start:13885 stop:14982 length:1098 start_codon:yes stop_codon:yes gene_type:complete